MPSDIRSMFPVFSQTSTTLLDNAAGSQLPRCVIDAAARYMRTSYANTGMAVPESEAVSRTIQRAHDVALEFVRGTGIGRVVLGPSSTGQCFLLAHAYADAMDSVRAGRMHTGEPLPRETLALGLPRRNRIVVSTAGHESNINPWTRLALRGFDVVLWPTERDADGNRRPLVSTLNKLMGDSTLLVAMPQVSNILGEVWDMRPYADAAHQAGAKIVVDGVASAPHSAPDVRAMDCDWYVYSAYKVFGPHMSVLYGRHDAFAQLTGPNHYFIPREEVQRKFEPGGVNHEGCAMLSALWEFVCDVTGEPADGPLRHEVFARAFERMLERERSLAGRVLAFLADHPRVRVVGPRVMDHNRIGLLSFIHTGKRSAEISRAGNAAGFAFRSGHSYARRLVEELREDHPSMDVEDGVVRISLMGYNTDAEVDRLLAFLEREL